MKGHGGDEEELASFWRPAAMASFQQYFLLCPLPFVFLLIHILYLADHSQEPISFKLSFF